MQATLRKFLNFKPEAKILSNFYTVKGKDVGRKIQLYPAIAKFKNNYLNLESTSANLPETDQKLINSKLD